ncbi:hypothetical protein [Rhodocaloribacter sp.]
MAAKKDPFILSNPLNDRVVRMLLAENVVTREQIEHAWLRWLRALRDGEHYPLWRELLDEPEVDVERIYEVAAKAYAFKRIHIGLMSTLVLVERLKKRIGDAQWNLLIEHQVLPVVERGQRPDAVSRISFATFDPAHPEIRRLVASLGLPFELRYAPASDLLTVTAEAFPRKKFLLGQAVF